MSQARGFEDQEIEARWGEHEPHRALFPIGTDTDWERAPSGVICFCHAGRKLQKYSLISSGNRFALLADAVPVIGGRPATNLFPAG